MKSHHRQLKMICQEDATITAWLKQPFHLAVFKTPRQNQFGKMLLKDESTMTLDAIESGENLLLNCITSTDIATRFGKYSKILALCTTKVQGQWGLSASVAVALGVIVVSPPEVEDTSSATTKEDDAASYFKAQTIDLDDDDEDDAEESPSEDEEESVEEEVADTTTDEKDGEETASKASESEESEWVDGDDEDDEWGDWE